MVWQYWFISVSRMDWPGTNVSPYMPIDPSPVNCPKTINGIMFAPYSSLSPVRFPPKVTVALPVGLRWPFDNGCLIKSKWYHTALNRAPITFPWPQHTVTAGFCESCVLNGSKVCVQGRSSFILSLNLLFFASSQFFQRVGLVPHPTNSKSVILFPLLGYWLGLKMPLPRHKWKAPDIVSGIPFDGRESVNFVKVSKQKWRVTVMSTEISVPVTSLFHTEGSTKSLLPPHGMEHNTGVYSNTEETVTSTAQKADQKGPSRSALVSSFGVLAFLSAHFDYRQRWKSAWDCWTNLLTIWWGKSVPLRTSTGVAARVSHQTCPSGVSIVSPPAWRANRASLIHTNVNRYTRYRWVPLATDTYHIVYWWLRL